MPLVDIETINLHIRWISRRSSIECVVFAFAVLSMYWSIMNDLHYGELLTKINSFAINVMRTLKTLS